MTLSFTLLMESALRATLFGVMVWLALKLARVRDSNAETAIWTLVLILAVAMPFLSQATPSLTIPFPALLWPTQPPVSIHAVLAVPGHAAPLETGAPLWDWLTRHAGSLGWGFYAAIASFQLLRLATGLALTLRLYRAAKPVAASWAQGRAIRVSERISGPISLWRCIVLPADCNDWPETQRIAVLAHEQCHVRRGDFFIQLLAALYRALFWFSPFAWWLQARLCVLAEVASDEAAIRQIKDRTSYAAILVDVSRRAHGLNTQIAMAKGPAIHWRVDRILAGSPERHLGVAARLAMAGVLLPAALFAASAHAALPREPAPGLPVMTPPTINDSLLAAAAGEASSALQTQSAKSAPRKPVAVTRRSKSHATQPAAPQDQISYNPRALLDGPEAVILPAMVPTDTSTNDKKKSDSAAIILNPAGE